MYEGLRFLSVPQDGGYETLQVGTTVFDFYEGTQHCPDGTKKMLKTNLRGQEMDFMRSLTVYSEKPVKILLDSGSWIPLESDGQVSLTKQPFRELQIGCTEETDVVVFASVCDEAMIHWTVGGRGVRISSIKVSVGVTRSIVAAANKSRKGVLIYNLSGVTIYVGGSGVTTTDGTPITNTSSMFFSSRGDIYAIAAGAATPVYALDEY